MSINSESRLRDHIPVLIGGLGTITACYALYKILQKYRDHEDCNYYKPKKVNGAHRRVLVLGLVGAGKTRLLQCFRQHDQDSEGELETPAATLGYNIASTKMGGVYYHFFEGGCVSYWDLDADVLIWVVDSSCPESFKQSKASLHQCIDGVDKSNVDESKSEACMGVSGIPIIVVATKQDVDGCATPDVVFQHMDINPLKPQHKVYIVGTQIPNKGERKGLWRLYELVAFAERKHWDAGTNPALVKQAEAAIE